MKSIVRSLAVAAAVSGLSAIAQEIEELDEEEAAATSEEKVDGEETPLEIGGQFPLGRGGHGVTPFQ